VLNVLQNAADSGKPPTAAQMNSFRTMINGVTSPDNPNLKDAVIARSVKNAFNAFVETAGPADVTQDDLAKGRRPVEGRQRAHAAIPSLGTESVAIPSHCRQPPALRSSRAKEP
jgi:hypothetical protein